jgi:hypothetical protein
MSRSEVRNRYTSPRPPARIRSVAAAQSGSNRRWKPTWKVTPAASAAAIASSAACRSSETGFSQKMCLPARLARMLSSACVPVGVAMTTASIAPSASMPS